MQLMPLSLVHLQMTRDCSAIYQGFGIVLKLRGVRSTQSTVPDLILSRVTRVVTWHISSQPTGPPASRVMGFKANEKQSTEGPAVSLAPSSLQEPRGPVTSKNYANNKPWYNPVTFCSGSNCYSKCIFIGTIPAGYVSQIAVLKVQK